jgi:Transposase, Mutator family
MTVPASADSRGSTRRSSRSTPGACRRGISKRTSPRSTPSKSGGICDQQGHGRGDGGRSRVAEQAAGGRAVVFLDCMVLKIREGGSVQRRACYLVLAIGMDGEREVLGMWLQANEGAKFWMQVLTDLKQRGVNDILIACVDGLRGFPEAIEAVFPATTVQTCIVHLIRHSLKYVPRRQYEQVTKDLRPIYTAIDADQAMHALEAFEEKWGKQIPVIGQAWRNAWEHVTPFMAFEPEVRRVIYTTNAIEALNRQLRKAVKTKGHFPTRGRSPGADLPRDPERRPAMDKDPRLDKGNARVQDPLRRPTTRLKPSTTAYTVKRTPSAVRAAAGANSLLTPHATPPQAQTPRKRAKLARLRPWLERAPEIWLPRPARRSHSTDQSQELKANSPSCAPGILREDDPRIQHRFAVDQGRGPPD